MWALVAMRDLLQNGAIAARSSLGVAVGLSAGLLCKHVAVGCMGSQ